MSSFFVAVISSYIFAFCGNLAKIKSIRSHADPAPEFRLYRPFRKLLEP
jgi:hypothetical protein